MKHICVTDEAFEKAQIKARDLGFPNVEAWIESLIEEDIREIDLENCLTPERMDKVRHAADQIRRGDAYTENQVDAHFEARRMTSRRIAE